MHRLDLLIDITDGQAILFRYTVSELKKLFPLLLALNVESCGLTQQLGTAAVLLFLPLCRFRSTAYSGRIC
jgi:hypothetical protein